MKFSVSTEAVLAKTPILDAIKTVAETGYDAIEFWTWRDKDLPAIVAECALRHVEITAFCAKWSQINNPSRHTEYLADLRETIAAAKNCGTRTLIAVIGDDTGEAREVQHAAIVKCLRDAAPMLEDAGITAAIEPLNDLYNHKGYYLTRSAEAFEIVHEVASPAVKVLYDIYHQQITEGDIINTLTANIAHIAHFHVAGHPGRNEPDDGEINYPNIFAAIDRTGYTGRVGLEYFPLRDPVESLRKLLVWDCP